MIRTLTPRTQAQIMHVRRDLAALLTLCRTIQAPGIVAVRETIGAIRRDVESIESSILDDMDGWTDDAGDRWSWDDVITLVRDGEEVGT